MCVVLCIWDTHIVPDLSLFCVACVGTFSETNNIGYAEEGYEMSYEDTLTDCQQLCVLDYPYCHAIDFTEGTCIMISEDTYRADKLVEKVDNIHSVLKPC